MTSMFSNLSAIVQNTLTDSIKMIDIDDLHESEDNFFNVERIEEFADTILGQGGVKDNLVVRPLESGGYEIISGHRRKAAVQLLIDRGEDISRVLPCLVQNYADDNARILDLVLMNVTARQLSDTEMWRSYELLKDILKEKQKSGESFGRIRDRLADSLGVSAAQVGKMENVEHNAVQQVVEAVRSGEISIHTANEIAKMDKSEQEQLVADGISNITPKEVKKKKAAKKQDTAKESATSSTIESEVPETTAEGAALTSQEESEESAISSTIEPKTPEDVAEDDALAFEEEPEEESATSSTIESEVPENAADDNTLVMDQVLSEEKLEEIKAREIGRIKWADSLTKEQRNDLFDLGYYNNTVKGYLIYLGRLMGWSKDQVSDALQNLNHAFSIKDKEGADEICSKWYNGEYED